MKTIKKEIQINWNGESKNIVLIKKLIETDKDFNLMVEDIKDSIKIAIDTENGNGEIERGALNPKYAIPAGFSLSVNGKVGYYIPVNHKDIKTDFIKRFNEILINKKLIIMWNSVYDGAIFKQHYNNDLYDYKWYDAMIAQHLLDAFQSKGLKYNTERYFKLKQNHFEWKDACKTKAVDIFEYACDDAIYTYLHYLRTKEEIKKQKLSNLLLNIEGEFLKVLARIKLNGFSFDSEKAKQIENKLIKDKIKLINKILKVTPQIGYIQDLLGGKKLNINLDSSKDLIKLLYDKLNLPIKSTTKSGAPATDAEAFKLMKDNFGEWLHPICPLLIKYKEIQKLLSAYTKSLYEKVIEGKIYGDLLDHGTESGRLSAKCIDGETIIDTKKGKEKLKNLCSKTKSQIHIIKTNKGYFKGKVFYSGIKPCIKITFKDSDKKIICTKEHRIQHHKNKFIPASELKKGFKLFNYDENKYLVISNIEKYKNIHTYDISIIEEEKIICKECHKEKTKENFKLKNQFGVFYSSICKECKTKKFKISLNNSLQNNDFKKKYYYNKSKAGKLIINRNKLGNKGYKFSKDDKIKMSNSRKNFIKKNELNYIHPISKEKINYLQYNKINQKIICNTEEHKLKLKKGIKNSIILKNRKYKTSIKNFFNTTLSSIPFYIKNKNISIGVANYYKNNPMTDEVKEKIRQARFKQKNVSPGRFGTKIKYKGMNLKSKPEFLFIKFLENQGIEYQYEPDYFKIDNRGYIPDFKIKYNNKIFYVEIKGEYLYKLSKERVDKVKKWMESKYNYILIWSEQVYKLKNINEVFIK